MGRVRGNVCGKRACRGVPEVEDGKAAGACGCGEVVPQVGEEGGEAGFMAMNLPEHYVYGCPKPPRAMLIITSSASAPE